MKKLFTLVGLVCLSVGAAEAQNQPTISSKSTKVAEKEALKKAQPEQRKVENARIEQRVLNAKRIDAENSQGAVMTEEQMKARTRENAGKADKKVISPDHK